MRVFYILHKGLELGGYSVVVADDKQQAVEMVMDKIRELDMDIEGIVAKEVDLDDKGVQIFFDWGTEG